MNISAVTASALLLAATMGASPPSAQTSQSPQLIEAAPATDPAPPANGKPRGPAPLAFQDCLRPERVRGWTYVANDELLVDAGMRHYRITLAVGCTALSMAQFITRFEAGHGSGRMCGMPQDYIRTDAGRCKVGKIELIDKPAYDGTPGRRGSLMMQSGAHSQWRGADRNAHPGLSFDASEREPSRFLAGDN
jgi:hypothetical protein